MPGESYCRQLRSLLLCLCDVFRAMIKSLCADFAPGPQSISDYAKRSSLKKSQQKWGALDYGAIHQLSDNKYSHPEASLPLQEAHVLITCVWRWAWWIRWQGSCRCVGWASPGLSVCPSPLSAPLAASLTGSWTPLCLPAHSKVSWIMPSLKYRYHSIYFLPHVKLNTHGMRQGVQSIHNQSYAHS